MYGFFLIAKNVVSKFRITSLSIEYQMIYDSQIELLF